MDADVGQMVDEDSWDREKQRLSVQSKESCCLAAAPSFIFGRFEDFGKAHSNLPFQKAMVLLAWL
jgi:hypothetical protein